MLDQSLNGKFVAIPISTLKSHQWRILTSSAQSVYTIMLTKYIRKGDDANGKVKWKQPELAEAVGLSLRTVNTCLQELGEKGFISVWEPGGRWLDGTTYTIEPEWANGEE